MTRTFEPAGLLKNPHVQSILASSGMRGWQARRRYPDLQEAEQALLLDGGDGVRLSALLSRQAPDKPSRGLAVLIHGWEGSVRSSYILSTGGRLYRDGFDVLRINLRDHGDSHGLNEELFHSCRIQEVVNAVRSQLDAIPHRKAIVGGFSLGGNFALRVARALPDRFDYVFAICPPLVPKHSLISIEQAPWFYHYYFMRKWTNSLALKQKLFPERFNFAAWKGFTIRQLTEALVNEHTDYPDSEVYLDGYAIGWDRLQNLNMPVLIVASADDPVIPVADFHQLQKPKQMQLEILNHGGHCGFLSNLKLESYIEKRLSHALADL
jgi:uncharacterized protein